ncbi:MAG TPA: amino acid ABC transporter permease [Tepidiformaceae bacterium]|nr:amino acid ABC transporter permease [Dehalococcoidia bacterium]HNO65719.1 amino acid ABC transporter permease [Tepidiformaceae bacterium]
MDALWSGFLDLLPGDWTLFKEWPYWRFLLEGLWVSVQIALAGIGLALVVGILMAVGRLSPIPIVRVLSTTYVETFRATPLLLLIFFVFFGAGRANTSGAKDFPIIDWFLDDTSGDLTPKASAILALALYNSAVVAEIMRAGILSISKGVLEASRTIGLTYLQSMRFIAVPMALRRMAPGLVSQLITLYKDTSLAALIAIEELLRRGKIMYEAPSLGNPTIEVLTVVALMYFIPNYALSLVAGRLERGPEGRRGPGNAGLENL